MQRILVLVLITFLIHTFSDSNACTTFLVSGKYTIDGRPLLYKHRDTDEPNNSLMKFTDGKYQYIGLVNATENWNKEVWGGYNETGFAIINSAAYTNNAGDTTKFMDQEGVVMKKALQYCATLQDFENLLDSLPKPMGVDANFGVIDAQGGAAYYETGNSKYIKVDANDPLLAPDGFLVRTNHSFSGDIDQGYGFIRYQTAYSALSEATASRQMNPQYLLNHISRNLTHSLTGENMESRIPESDETPDFRFFIDYIPRNSSASTVLIVGTPQGQDAQQTMMWSLTGFQLTTLAIPVWLRKNIDLPQVVTIGKDGHAPICDAALQLKEKCFPIKRGSGAKYINFAVIENQQGTGFLQQIRTAEIPILKEVATLDSSDEKQLHNFYKWIDQYVTSFYEAIK